MDLEMTSAPSAPVPEGMAARGGTAEVPPVPEAPPKIPSGDPSPAVDKVQATKEEEELGKDTEPEVGQVHALHEGAEMPSAEASGAEGEGIRGGRRVRRRTALVGAALKPDEEAEAEEKGDENNQKGGEDEEETTVRCLCGVEEEDNFKGKWVSCDACGCWLHQKCVKFKGKAGDLYTCPFCPQPYSAPALPPPHYSLPTEPLPVVPAAPASVYAEYAAPLAIKSSVRPRSPPGVPALPIPAASMSPASFTWSADAQPPAAPAPHRPAALVEEPPHLDVATAKLKAELVHVAQTFNKPSPYVLQAVENALNRLSSLQCIV